MATDSKDPQPKTFSHPDITDPDVLAPKPRRGRPPKAKAVPEAAPEAETEAETASGSLSHNVCLQIPAAKKYASVGHKSLSDFNLKDVQSFMPRLIEALRRTEVTYAPRADKELIQAFSSLLTSNTYRATGVMALRVVSAFIRYPENALQLIPVVPELRKLTETLLEKDILTFDEVKAILGREPILIKTGSYYETVLQEPLLLPFKVLAGTDYHSYTIDLKKCSFAIRPELRHRLSDMVYGPGALAPRMVGQLPADAGLVTEDFESQLPEDFGFLTELHAAGTLLTKAGTITQARITATGGQLPGGDFALRHKEETPRGDFMALAAMMYVKRRRSPKSTDSLETFLRFVVEKMAKNLLSVSFAPFLPHLSHFTQTGTSNSNATVLVATLQSLIRVRDGEWMEMSNFGQRFKAEDVPASYDDQIRTLLFYNSWRSNSPGDLERRTETKKAGRPVPIDPYCDVTWPFVINWLRALCAVGIVQLAVDPAAPAGDTNGGIRYVRLTATGKYALGLAKKLDIKLPEAKTYFELDTTECIATLIEANSPFSLFMNKIGRPISSNRFKVTPQTFMAGCQDKDEVLARIKTFRKLAHPAEGGIWDRMLKETERRSEAALSDRNYYAILHLDLSIPGLADTINNDPDIRAIVKRAEGGYIIIPHYDLSKFKQLLAKHGYLL